MLSAGVCAFEGSRRKWVLREEGRMLYESMDRMDADGSLQFGIPRASEWAQWRIWQERWFLEARSIESGRIKGLERIFYI